ncbi:MAG: DUF2225 domain-containing protein [Dehalococcoidia bacterium]
MSTPIPADEYLAGDVPCPACNVGFQAVQVRTTALRPRRQLSDFYTEYDGPNPAHYAVWVCRSCLYASYRYNFRELAGHARNRIRADEARRKAEYGGYDFEGLLRDRETVQASYELAIRCYEIRRARIAYRAALYLHLAWLAREAQDTEQERHWLELALKHYQQSYTKEQARSTKDEIKQTYFIGDLSLQLGRYQEAVRWFHETVSHPAIGEYPGLARRARSRWADAREAARKGKERRK